MNACGEAPTGRTCTAGRARGTRAAAVALALLLLHGWPGGALGSEPPAAVALAEGWQVRWGEAAEGALPAPPAAGVSGGWAPADLPVVASGLAELRTVWLTRRLPDRRFRDPVLLASAVDQTLEVWIDGRPVYRLGDVAGRRQTFATAAWSHLVTLPEDFGGKEVTLRIRSSYSRAGVGAIRIGPRRTLVRELLAGDVAWLVFGLLALFSGVLELLVFLRRREQRLHLAFGGFALAIGVFLLGQTVLAQLLVDAPMFWTWLVFASLYLTPAGAIAFVEELFGPRPASLLRRARHACAAYAAGALALAALGAVSLTGTLPPFLVLLAASATLTAAITARAALGGSREGRILLLGMTGLLAAAANDILVSLGVLTWLVRIVDEATFVFLLSLGGIAASRLGGIREQLQAYSHTLERQNAELTVLKDGLEHIVVARTRELETARDELQLRNRDLADKNALLARRAACDSLTGLLNHGAFVAELDSMVQSRRAAEFPISVVMLDLDHFKTINDRFGHQTGDEVLRRVSAALRDVVREGDVAARYGGEEFTLLLPRCSAASAHGAAERLREAIAAIRVPGAPELRVSASFGITAVGEPHAGVDGRELIGRADEALYAAKNAGRDRVCFLPAPRAAVGPRA